MTTTQPSRKRKISESEAEWIDLMKDIVEQSDGFDDKQLEHVAAETIQDEMYDRCVYRGDPDPGEIDAPLIKKAVVEYRNENPPTVKLGLDLPSLRDGSLPIEDIAKVIPFATGLPVDAVVLQTLLLDSGSSALSDAADNIAALILSKKYGSTEIFFSGILTDVIHKWIFMRMVRQMNLEGKLDDSVLEQIRLYPGKYTENISSQTIFSDQDLEQEEIYISDSKNDDDDDDDYENFVYSESDEKDGDDDDLDSSKSE